MKKPKIYILLLFPILFSCNKVDKAVHEGNDLYCSTKLYSVEGDLVEINISDLENTFQFKIPTDISNTNDIIYRDAFIIKYRDSLDIFLSQLKCSNGWIDSSSTGSKLIVSVSDTNNLDLAYKTPELENDMKTISFDHYYTNEIFRFDSVIEFNQIFVKEIKNSYTKESCISEIEVELNFIEKKFRIEQINDSKCFNAYFN